MGWITTVIKQEVLKKKTKKIPIIYNLAIPEKCGHCLVSIGFHINNVLKAPFVFSLKRHDKVLGPKDMNCPSTDSHFLGHIRVSQKFVNHILNDYYRLVDLWNEQGKLVDSYFVQKLHNGYFLLMFEVSNVLAIKFIIISQVEGKTLVNQVVNLFWCNYCQISNNCLLNHILINLHARKKELFLLMQASFVVHFVVELLLEDV